ncbi:hypothetical protein [Streptomyces noursei]
MMKRQLSVVAAAAAAVVLSAPSAAAGAPSVKATGARVDDGAAVVSVTYECTDRQTVLELEALTSGASDPAHGVVRISKLVCDGQPQSSAVRLESNSGQPFRTQSTLHVYVDLSAGGTVLTQDERDINV